MGLKGKDGTSMRQAVEGMKHFRNNIMNAFYFGLLMFAVAAVWLVWFKARSRQLPRLPHPPPTRSPFACAARAPLQRGDQHGDRDHRLRVDDLQLREDAAGARLRTLATPPRGSPERPLPRRPSY